MLLKENVSLLISVKTEPAALLFFRCETSERTVRYRNQNDALGFLFGAVVSLVYGYALVRTCGKPFLVSGRLFQNQMEKREGLWSSCKNKKAK